MKCRAPSGFGSRAVQKITKPSRVEQENIDQKEFADRQNDEQVMNEQQRDAEEQAYKQRHAGHDGIPFVEIDRGFVQEGHAIIPRNTPVSFRLDISSITLEGGMDHKMRRLR